MENQQELTAEKFCEWLYKYILQHPKINYIPKDIILEQLNNTKWITIYIDNE